MDVYKVRKFGDAVEGNKYPGRGIVVGQSCDGTKAVIAYFIMGRSVNSRNRVFVERDGAVFTEPFDVSKLEDPSLIIYAAVRTFEDHLIVTNGDQTDTIYDGLAEGKSFYEALESRCFEPDAPNFTPRISAEAVFDGEGAFRYRMSILKSADAEGSACNRFGYDYAPVCGTGHFIHTYEHDGNPLPTFQGEPERVEIPDSIDAFTEEIWNALDEDNKISLYVRYTDIASGETESRLINKNC
ncbi:MAG: IMP cyclohydrolase [Mogibacterium sp.]|nr:IMP cyclohydrolase [Mogibacterium sp.]